MFRLTFIDCPDRLLPKWLGCRLPAITIPTGPWRERTKSLFRLLLVPPSVCFLHTASQGTDTPHALAVSHWKTLSTPQASTTQRGHRCTARLQRPRGIWTAIVPGGDSIGIHSGGAVLKTSCRNRPRETRVTSRLVGSRGTPFGYTERYRVKA